MGAVDFERFSVFHLTEKTVYGAVWLSFWCSTRPPAPAGNSVGSILPCRYLHQPKAELNTKNSTKRRRTRFTPLDGTLKIAQNLLPPFHRGNFTKKSRFNCVVFHNKCSTKGKKIRKKTRPLFIIIIKVIHSKKLQ